MNCVATTGTTGELQGGNDFVLDPAPPEPIPEKAPLGERDASWRSPTWALRRTRRARGAYGRSHQRRSTSIRRHSAVSPTFGSARGSSVPSTFPSRSIQ